MNFYAKKSSLNLFSEVAVLFDDKLFIVLKYFSFDFLANLHFEVHISTHVSQVQLNEFVPCSRVRFMKCLRFAMSSANVVLYPSLLALSDLIDIEEKSIFVPVEGEEGEGLPF